MKEIIYRFSPNVSRKKIRLIRALDQILGVLRGEAPEVDKTGIKSITITQLAHIGDLVLLMPALKKLRVLTDYKINLVVSSQNYSIAAKLKYLDSVTVADAPYFARSTGSSYKKFFKQLRQIKTDLIFDVRGDLRNNFFIKLLTRHKTFAGYNVGGGDSILDVSLPYGFNKHIAEILNPLFDYLNVPDVDLAACWHEADLPSEPIQDHVFPDNFIVVHLGAGAESRKWPFENFLKVIKELSKDVTVYVLGVKQDLSEHELVLLENLANVEVCINKYNILQSISIVKKSSLFLGLDSGFTHIAAMCRKKVIVLFSGVANVNVWRPYNFYTNQVTVIKHSVPCDSISGCGKFTCENHICMENIVPIQVIAAIKKQLAILV